MSAFFVVQIERQLRTTIHMLYRVCEKSMAQKLLNAAMLFKDHVYTQTAAMCNLGDVFAADILYHDYCCRDILTNIMQKLRK